MRLDSQQGLGVVKVFFFLVWFIEHSLSALISHMHPVGINFLLYSNNKRVKSERRSLVFYRWIAWEQLKEKQRTWRASLLLKALAAWTCSVALSWVFLGSGVEVSLKSQAELFKGRIIHKIRY